MTHASPLQQKDRCMGLHMTARSSRALDPMQVVEELCRDDRGPYDIGFLFSSHPQPMVMDKVARHLVSHLNLRHLWGGSVSGVIDAQHEYEDEPAFSLLLGRWPQVNIQPFYFDQSHLERLRSPEDWYAHFDVYPNEHPKFFLMPDPFSLDMKSTLEGFNTAYPGCPVVGGLASGTLHMGGNVLFLDGESYASGAVGLIITGDLLIETVVSQGCRPIGENYIVTASEGNIIYALAGKSFLQILEEVLNNLSIQDRALAQEALFVGIAMNEYKHKMRRGDFLVRHLMGIDEATGAGAIADLIRNGQTVQFQVRDAATADEDLHALLRRQQSYHPEDKPAGALVFNCTGRGRDLFRIKDHDINVIQQHIGQRPVAGCFAAGEIGPVGGKNFIHGFTSSLVMFYPGSSPTTGHKQDFQFPP